MYVFYYFLLAAQGIAGSSFALIYQCGFETCFGKVGAGMTQGRNKALFEPFAPVRFWSA